MQFNRYITLPKSNLFNYKLFFLLRLLLFVAIGVYLWQAVVANQRILMNLDSVKVQWQTFDFLLLLLTVVLLPINWLLEGLKWQVIARDADLSLKQAIKGVVLGLTLDNVLPVGTGAISGRVITLSKESRIKVIPGILVGQAIQTIVTLLFGLYGFWLVWSKASSLFNWQPAYTFILFGAILAVVLSGVFWRIKIRKFLVPLRQYSIGLWGLISVFSISRYLVFLLQFLILSIIFAPTTSLTLLFGCATWVFAARTFMPKISNLERLGIRALAVVFFMDLFNQSPSGVLIAVITLWFINLAVPSLIGLIFLRNLKVETLLK